MPGLANDLNISQPGYVVHNGAGVFSGRTFQAGTGITLTNADGISGNTTITASGSNDLHTSQFIVNSSGTSGTGANFTTIAAAIAAAQGTGLKQTVFIMPGSTGNYTENLTLVPNINLSAFGCDSSSNTTANVTITGKLTLTTAGTVSISGIQLKTNSDFFLAVTGSAASVVNLNNCYLNALNNTGISYTSSSGSSLINISNCMGNIGTTGISLFSKSSSGKLNIFNSYITNTGNSTTASTASAGILSLLHSEFDFPITTSGTNTLGSTDNNYNTTNAPATITFGGSGGMSSSGDYFSTGNASAITVSGNTLSLTSATVDSTNTNVITGGGTLQFGNVDFVEGSLINTTTQVPLIASNAAVKVTTPGAYPYTTVPQDAVILVDSSSARTITPLASPTTGQMHRIKDNAGTAGTNNITITPSGKNIDGAASYVINTNYGSVDICYNGTQWIIL